MERGAKIREFIESHLVTFDDHRTPRDEDNIFELGFVDSLFALELVRFIEQELGFELTNEDLEISNFSSVNNILAFIGKKRP
ncbi:MAG: acyl carrier protein [Acidobacteriota bacterium]